MNSYFILKNSAHIYEFNLGHFHSHLCCFEDVEDKSNVFFCSVHLDKCEHVICTETWSIKIEDLDLVQGITGDKIVL